MVKKTRSENYYSKELFLAKVDKEDNVVGKVERWKAHREGVLHRGFTAAIFYKDQIVCQHRKHLVFDGYLDLTCSSHPIFIKDELQSNLDSIYFTLEREWGIRKENLISHPKPEGKVYYNSSDGRYAEHEVCYLYSAKIKSLPKPNFNYSYGFSLLEKSQLKLTKFPFRKSLAPWVLKFLEKELI